VIDLYCERVAPGLWGEPLNVLSSAGYLVVGWLLLRAHHSDKARDRQALTLAALPIAIAAGSVLFHAFATPWARRFDEAPILAFQLLFAWMYTRRALLWPSRAAAGGVVLLVLAVSVGRVADGLNGSAPYLPPLVVAAAICFRHRGRTGRLDLLAPLVLFALAVLCRAIDNAACVSVPTGTHFLWHVLTAFVLYAFAQVAIRDPQPVSRKP
jgi:hypothetical protein